jgi:hypothetical protein
MEYDNNHFIIASRAYSLQVCPVIHGYEFSKCLMDGGSSLNIMYVETLTKLGLTKTQLRDSAVTFYGVVPGCKAKSLGSITLMVAFGSEENYQEEPIVDGFRVARTRGTTRRTQRFEHRGLNVGDLGSQRNTMTKASSRRMHNTLQRGIPSFTQVKGPRGEVKPLLPAFLYYDATPHEEYKVLVTEL